MIFRGPTGLLASAVCAAFACILFVSPERCLGQTDQPREVATPPPPVTGDANVGTARARNEGDTTATNLSDGDSDSNSNSNSTRTTKIGKGRTLKEEMVVIDAATRKKQREKEMANHDKTFDSSILDVGVDSVVIGKASPKPEARATAKPIVTPSPAAESSATPAPVSALQPEPGADASVNLEVVPVIKSESQQPSPAPSATASPHD